MSSSGASSGASVTNYPPVIKANAGEFYVPAGEISNGSRAFTNQIVLAPLVIPAAATAAKLRCIIGTAGAAGSVVRFGLYSPDATGRPGALLLDAGTVPADGATGVAELAINKPLPAGLVWATVVGQLGAPLLTYLQLSSWNPIAGAFNFGEASSGALNYMHTTVAGGNNPANVPGALPANLVLGYNNNGGSGGVPFIGIGV